MIKTSHSMPEKTNDGMRAAERMGAAGEEFWLVMGGL